MKQHERIVVSIEKPAAGGRMIARHEGAVVLVSGVIPGEVAEIEIERVQRGTAWGHVVRLLEASPDRRVPAVDTACGGNAFAHIAYERQLALKREIVMDGFRRIGRLEMPAGMPAHASPADGYRMRARLHVRRGRIGFFREGTHDLCAPASAGQLLPDAVAALTRLEAVLASVPQTRVTEIELAESIDGRARVCHLELAPDGDPTALPALAVIEGLTGVSWSPAGAEGSLTLAGDPTVSDTVMCELSGRQAAVTLRRHARAFFQGNRFLVEPLVHSVARRAGDGPVIDLYSGVGLFALTLAGLGWVDVTAVEGDPWSAEDLARNAAQAGPSLTVAPRSVEAFVAGAGAVRPATTVIVDPPRTGLSRDALRGTLALGADRLVYVSCDIATLARDAHTIVDAGYSCGDVEIFDLFPNTAHVETMVTFEKGVARQ
jgi:23S rRNA (uracil1939-C5)-methyltransferase